MPIYEYECTQCGKVTEAWQSFKDSPLQECPECAGKLQKLISMSTFHLKGGGWYADGYASKGCAKGGGKDGGACSSDSGNSTKGCDAGKGCCAAN